MNKNEEGHKILEQHNLLIYKLIEIPQSRNMQFDEEKDGNKWFGNLAI